MRSVSSGLRSAVAVLAATTAVAAGPVGADDCTPAGGDPRVCAGNHDLVLSERYLLAVHAAAPGATFAEHQTYLLESEDGADWSLVSGWEPYRGSVPEVILRGSHLYLFNPGKQRVYDLDAGTVTGDAVAIADAEGTAVNYVDPSAIFDGAGRIVLFFLNSTGVPLGTDPASGTDPKDFDSAIEDADSVGLSFTLEDGPRLEALGSDPDVFFDGTRFVLLLSYGSNTRAYSSSTLHGSYEPFAGLGSEALLTSAGGVPAGYYDAEGGSYWTYVHAHESGATVVRRAVHAGFSTPLSSADFTTVVDASDLGLAAGTGVESPSFFDRQAESSVPLPGVHPPGLSLLAALVVLAALRRFRSRDAGARFRPTPAR